MVGTRTPTTRRRSARFACRYTATESSRRPALGCIFAHDGPGRRSIEMSDRNFFAELKRRNVYKVAVAYIVAGWALAQGIAQVFPVFNVPNWVVRLIVVLTIIGFPFALIFAWAFQITPDGLQRTEEADPMPAPLRPTSRTWIYIVVIGVVMSAGLFFLGYTAGNRSTSPQKEQSNVVQPFPSL